MLGKREEAFIGQNTWEKLVLAHINAWNIGKQKWQHRTGNTELLTSTTGNSNLSNKNEIGSHMSAGLMCKMVQIHEMQHLIFMRQSRTTLKFTQSIQ